MTAHNMRVSVAAVLLVFLSATTIPAPISAQGRPAPAAFDCSTATGIPFSECHAPIALYTSTNGAGWTNQSGWLTTNTPCSWYGVTCDTGGVTQLSPGFNQLSGRIPPELGNLANLKALYLNSNQLRESIPPELGDLANLQYLDLGGNQLRGPLPQSLTNLHTLGNFYLDTVLLCLPDNSAFAAW